MSKQIKSPPILLINRDLIVVSVLKIALIFLLIEKESGEKEKKCIYVGYIVPLRVYSVTPYDTDDGDSFNKIDVIDSF